MLSDQPTLQLLRCPIHPEFWAVSVDADTTGGYRITPSKCCGRWDLVRSWRLELHAIDGAIAELRRAKRRLVRQEKQFAAEQSDADRSQP